MRGTGDEIKIKLKISKQILCLTSIDIFKNGVGHIFMK